MTGNSAYLTGLDRNAANYAPLTPLTFLERAAYVHPDHPSVVHGAQRFTWRETYWCSSSLMPPMPNCSTS